MDFRSWPIFNIKKIKIPLGVTIAVCVFPAVLTILFYSLRPLRGVMDWAALNVSAPVRNALGFLSSIYPISIMEILLTAAGVWIIYYIVRSVMATMRRRGTLKILAKRLLVVVTAALYVWGLFCWLWNCGYSASRFAERNGFKGGGIATEDLAAVAKLFAEKANELAPLVTRDEDGHFIEDRRAFFAEATAVYDNIMTEVPNLSGNVYRPKSMMYSWLMSRTGYTGIYFALTGESNVNTRMPLCLMPATVAHELAHQRGVYAEDEANFVGIAACISSGNTVYEYSGYLSGLMYLSTALSFADYDAYLELHAGLADEVRQDWQDNAAFWLSQKTVDTGVDFIDNILTATTEVVSDTVDAVYDVYLRTNEKPLGLQSYGACVDLLVEYYAATAHRAINP
jgi:hypothetical protein